MKSEKAELLEIFLKDDEVGIIEFTDFDKREVSRRGGVKLTIGGKLEYISEKKIDRYEYTIIQGQFIIAVTDENEFDSRLAVRNFLKWALDNSSKNISIYDYLIKESEKIKIKQIEEKEKNTVQVKKIEELLSLKYL